MSTSKAPFGPAGLRAWWRRQVRNGQWPATLPTDRPLPSVVTRGDPVSVIEKVDSRRESFWRAVCREHPNPPAADLSAAELAVADASAHRREAHSDVYDEAVRAGHVAGEPFLELGGYGPCEPNRWCIPCRCGLTCSSVFQGRARERHTAHVEGEVALGRTLDVVLCGALHPDRPDLACTMPSGHGPFAACGDDGQADHGAPDAGLTWRARTSSAAVA
jgi:hypothetical protein